MAARTQPTHSSKGLTRGAGPHKHRPPPIPIAVSQHSPPLDTPTNVRVRTPARTSTLNQEVDLGVYMEPERPMATAISSMKSSLPIRASFSAWRASLTTKPSNPPPEDLFLPGGQWKTDIGTFCSHTRIGSTLGQARITHIQARKSKRLPFLHEYILVFFVAVNDQRFVARIDRLGKLGSTPEGGFLGWCIGRNGQASNTAIQQVGVYRVQDNQIGIDDPEGPWYDGDRGWGSDPIATLVTWSHTSEDKRMSHILNPAGARVPAPLLNDVSRLLEAILLEMPTYHLVTTNCYFMTRSSLMLLLRCFPHSFACRIGSASDDLIPSSELAEPIWAGLLHWYLPFTIIAFLAYIPVIIGAHIITGNLTGCGSSVCPDSSQDIVPAARLAVHGLLDVPLPLGILHAWITALEIRMNGLVLKLSIQFQTLGRERTVAGSTLLEDNRPFGVAFQKAWLTFLAWFGVGLLFALTILVTLLSNPIVIFVFFLLSVIAAVIFNLKYPDSGFLVSGQVNSEQESSIEAPVIVLEPLPMGNLSRRSSAAVVVPFPAQ